MTSITRLFPGLFSICFALVFLAACGSAEMRSITQTSPREEYRAFLQARLASDTVYNFDTMSSALIVKALPYTRAVEMKARGLFHGDPVFSREVLPWDPARNTVVLVGVFSPDLGEKDFEEGRFRPALTGPDGRFIRAAKVTPHGRKSDFARDYFPAFDPWEEVFAVRFPVPAHDLTNHTFVLEWPGGVQTVPLKNF